MRTAKDLARKLSAIDGQGYSNYRSIVGTYELPDAPQSPAGNSAERHPEAPAILFIDKAQVDPYAPPSRVRLFIPADLARIPNDFVADHAGRVAVGDFLTRTFAQAAKNERDIRIAMPGQEILERTSVIADDTGVEARFTVRLPAAGRRIRGREAQAILLKAVPRIAAAALYARSIDLDALESCVAYMRDREDALRQMAERSLIAFVADGAILPRISGDSDKPLADGAVPFESPEELRVRLDLPSGASLTGMGIPAGISVIVGGGYHGKSTLLRALERAVYPHIAGDGREWVLADESAAAIRAEDGRSVANVNISPFINGLPSGKPTQNFTTTNASGSTSQAANVMEALRSGARVLLIDEDTSATNFMIRDSVMRTLIPAEHEPITPLVDRIQELRDECGISTVIVAGGSSAFFAGADRVIAMDAYEPHDVTLQAHELSKPSSSGAVPSATSGTAQADTTQTETVPGTAQTGTAQTSTAQTRRTTGSEKDTATGAHMPENSASSAIFSPTFTHRRVIDPRSLHPGDKKKPAQAHGLYTIRYGHADIDLSALEQLVDPAQTCAIAEALECYSQEADGESSIQELTDRILDWIDEGGLDALTARGRYSGNLARPRRHELVGALNRLRIVRIH